MKGEERWVVREREGREVHRERSRGGGRCRERAVDKESSTRIEQYTGKEVHG